MGRGKDVRSRPVPASGLEVTEGGCLPVAFAIDVAVDEGTIGNQTPHVHVRCLPDDMREARQPARWLEDLARLGPLPTTTDPLAQRPLRAVGQNRSRPHNIPTSP